MNWLSADMCYIKRILIIFVGIVVVVRNSFADSDINCILLKHCPLALKLVETKRNDPQAIKFLRFTHCGFKGKEPMVWCNLFDKCKTPDGAEGRCISVRKCNTFVNLIRRSNIRDPKVETYLKEFRCSTVYDPDIKVCCADDTETIEVDDNRVDIPENTSIENRFSVSLPNPHLQECGRQNNDNRIYGGVEADLDEYPWMVLFKYQTALGNFSYGCSGSLIHSRFVLTAAHCLDPIILRSKGLRRIHRVILGEYDIRNETDCIYHKFGKDCADPSQQVEMESYKLHPGYMSGYTEHDIGLIKLREKVRFSSFIKPICLPPSSTELTEKDIYMISGWGKTPTESVSSVKRKAQIKIVSKDNCNVLREKPLEDFQICAGGTGDGVEACFGDSGGPLMLGRNLNNDFINFILGIVSHGFGRTCGGKPGVFTYVPYYVEWIQSNLVF